MTQTILITGASEGMGLSAARQLSAKGANIIIVSRTPSKLQAALEEIRSAARDPATQRFHLIPADVSSPGYATAVLDEAASWNGGQLPDAVWCIAGAATPGLFVDVDMATMRWQMDVNYFGTAEMSHAIMKRWLAEPASANKEEDARHLVMTTSVVAFYSIPGYAPYAPAKAAIKSLADTISQEALLYPQDIKVHVVCPGTILSPGFDRETQLKPEVTKKLEETDPKQTPDEVARAAIRGLERGHYLIAVNWLGTLMKWAGLAGSFRNSWVIDTLGALFVVLIWPIVHMDIHGKIRDYGKKHMHPATK